MTAPNEHQLHDPAWWDENAPEGATHIDGNAKVFIKRNGRDWLHYLDGEWLSFAPVRRAISRPTKPQAPEWDGEQFPIPIGAKCECTFAVEHHDTWHKGKVVFHGVDPEGREYIVVDTGAYQACFRSLNHIRPIRTKEQRERDDLQEDLNGILPFVEFNEDQIKELAAILYAQGYRKPDSDPMRKVD